MLGDVRRHQSNASSPGWSSLRIAGSPDTPSHHPSLSRITITHTTSRGRANAGRHRHLPPSFDAALASLPCLLSSSRCLQPSSSVRFPLLRRVPSRHRYDTPSYPVFYSIRTATAILIHPSSSTSRVHYCISRHMTFILFFRKTPPYLIPMHGVQSPLLIRNTTSKVELSQVQNA